MVDGGIADTYAPVKIKGQTPCESRTRTKVRVRGEPIVSSSLETFPNRKKVASREVDEIHIQLLQSQLEDGQLIRQHGNFIDVGNLVQACRDGFAHITSPIFGGNVEIGPYFERSVGPLKPGIAEATLQVHCA